MHLQLLQRLHRSGEARAGGRRAAGVQPHDVVTPRGAICGEESGQDKISCAPTEGAKHWRQMHVLTIADLHGHKSML